MSFYLRGRIFIYITDLQVVNDDEYKLSRRIKVSLNGGEYIVMWRYLHGNTRPLITTFYHVVHKKSLTEKMVCKFLF